MLGHNQKLGQMPRHSTKYPRRVFKFLSSEYVDGLLAKGIIRIGTLREFRQPDGKDGARADEHDGITSWKLPLGEVSPTDTQKFFETLNIKSPEGFKSKTQGDTRFRVTTEGFLLCSSLGLDDGIKRRMLRDFEADACVEIKRLDKVFEALSRHPLLERKPFSAGFVRYVPSKESETFHGHDPFAKAEDYRWQREYRALWQTDHGGEGSVIEVPEISKYLRRVY